MKNIITRDKTLVYGYDVEIKVITTDVSCFDMPQESTTCVPESENNVDLFNYSSTLHQELVPAGQMVYQAYYHEVLRHMMDATSRKRLEMWTVRMWHLHHNNVPAHAAFKSS
jgi:hypothetical protein